MHNLRPVNALRVLLCLCLLAASWAVSSCDNKSQPAPETAETPLPPEPPTFLTLVFSGNIKGIIDPCGCVKKQLGGLARRASVIEGLREKSDNVVYVDYGNWLFPMGPVPEVEREQRIEKARLQIEAANQMKLAAFTPGPSDFAAGTGTLKELLKKAAFHAVSANLVDPASRELLFPAYAIVEVGGLRLGITGVSEPVSTIPQLAGEAEALPPVEALRGVLAELRPRVHRILVLARPGGEARFEISALEGVDFVIGAPGDVPVGEAQAANLALVASVSDRGQRVGSVSVQLQPGRKGYYRGERMLALEQEIKDAQARAEKARAAGDEELAAGNEKLIAFRTEDLAKLKDRMGFLASFFEIDENVEPDEQQFLLVDNFRRQQEARAREVYGRDWEKYLKDQHDFAGAQACMGCHQGQYEHWLGTRHASAFASLEKTHQGSDHECLKCHTTGYQNAFIGDYAPELFRGVQCESCHGESAPHSREPQLVKTPWVIDSLTCRRCHGIQHGENFNFDEALPKILHPGHGEHSVEAPHFEGKVAPQPGDAERAGEH
ncbi:MAG: hypothetical protein KDH09_02125 [Chrysiogenetes bacterium]|nr:hypothetical protein [Chrysiogenetes bacterium]